MLVTIIDWISILIFVLADGCHPKASSYPTTLPVSYLGVQARARSLGINGGYENLQRRFQRVPRAAEPVVYEFTDDRALLHQNYRIWELMYRKIHHSNKFSGKEGGVRLGGTALVDFARHPESMNRRK